MLHWASLGVTIAGVVLLLLARGHYSIDVLIAYWITTRVWWLYHTMVNNTNLKGDIDNSSNYLNRRWWWYIFRYFEKNVPVNLPRRFGWPIPRRLRRWKPASFFFRRRSLRHQLCRLLASRVRLQPATSNAENVTTFRRHVL